MNLGNQPALEGRSVLIIEDTPENLRLFRAILKLEGARVLEANRAPAGIAIAEQEQPDVILMDLQMPGMDGLTATRLLHAASSTSHIPVVVVTASTMEEDRIKAVEAGCNGYIVKPVDPMNFGRQIASIIQGAFLPDAPRTMNPPHASKSRKVTAV